MRASIDEILLFRLGTNSPVKAAIYAYVQTGPPADDSTHPLNFFRHRKDVFVPSEGSYQLLQTRELYLTQDLGYTLKVAVSPYVPVPGDKTAYEWRTKDGVHKMEMPPYCLSNVEEIKLRMFEYTYVSGLSYLQNLLDSSNKILWDTFEIALRSGVSKCNLKTYISSLGHAETISSESTQVVDNQPADRENLETLWRRYTWS